MSLQSIPTILDIDQDILIIHVLSQVQPRDLTNFLLSSKTFYANRRDYVKANEYTQKFMLYDDTKDYFSVILNSHIMPACDFTICFPTDSKIDETKIRNTTSIVQFHQHIGENNEATFRQYMLDLLHYQFAYTRSKINEGKIDAFFGEKWWMCNVNCYDIYQIVYHMSRRKYRALAECLKNLTFINNDFCNISLRVLIETINNQNSANIKLKIILVYVLYSYIEKIIDKISSKAYAKLFVEFAKKIRDAQISAETKSFPQYLKSVLLTKFSHLRNLIEDRLSTMDS